MNEQFEKKRKANELRKAGNYEDALPIYESLVDNSYDKFDATGLLSCYRKTKQFEKAIPLAETLIQKHRDFDWTKIEVIWTYIQAVLYNYDKYKLEEIINYAKKIESLKPDKDTYFKVVMRLLKIFKENGKDELIDEWVIKINGKELSAINNVFEGKEIWSDKAIWYNYYLNSLLRKNQFDEIIKIADEILLEFPRQKKFFLRLKGLAYQGKGDLESSVKIFESLTKVYQNEWWLLCEYAEILKNNGDKDVALKFYCLAALSCRKFEMMVKMVEEIGKFCIELDYPADALNHLIFAKLIREKNQWGIKYELINNIDILKAKVESYVEPTSLEDAQKKCKKFWNIHAQQMIKAVQKIRRALKGKIRDNSPDRPFAFVDCGKGEAIIYFKNENEKFLKHGDNVVFDAIPSYDKRKEQDSWKAVNLKLFN